MNYHLNRNGQNLGAFPLDELRRRCATGELTGKELIWCPGMPNWQTLESVLALPVSPATLVPVQQKSSNIGLIIAGGVGLFLLLSVCLVLVFRPASKAIKKETIRLLNEVSQSAADGPAMAAASKPVKAGPKTQTANDAKKRAREFRVRQWVDGYKLRGEHKLSYDADAARFLDAWIAKNFAGREFEDKQGVSILGDKLAGNSDCKDPLLLTVAALESVELFEANHRLERALQEFGNSKHKAYPKFYANITLAKKLTKDKTYRVPVLDAAALQFLKECFTDGSFLAEDQAEIAELIIDGAGEDFWKRNRGAICETVDAQGSGFQWLKLVLKGESAVKDAWAARGSGYSGTVTRQGWDGFEKNLEKAEKYLTEAWQLRPDLAMAPAQMIYVSLGSGGIEQMRLWFDRAVEAQIDYPAAWSNLRWGLRPRWFGDLNSMLALGVTAVNTKRFDSDAPEVFFHVLGDVESEMGVKGGEHLYGREDIWPHLKEMYEGYLGDPSHAPILAGWRSSYAVTAYLAGHYDTAAQQLEALDWKPKARNLTGWGVDLSVMTLEVAARTGKHGTAVNEAEGYRKKQKLAEALRLYTELSDASDLDFRTRAFVNDRVATLNIEKQFQAGEWVPMMPADTNLVGWCLSRGTCLSASKEVVEIQSGPAGHIVYSRARIGADYEVKGSFEVVKSSNDSFQGGLVMGLPQFESWGWNAFRIKRNSNEGQVASFSQNWTTKQVVSPVSLTSSNSFHLRCRNGKITASVNDKEIFREVTMPENYYLTEQEFFFGLGAFNDMNTTTIRYRDIQVKKM